MLIGVFLTITGAGNGYFLLVTGFCGGFTTFSAFSAELLAMVRQAHYLQSALYIVASIAVCVAAVWLGTIIGERFK